MTGTAESASWTRAPGWMKALLVASLLGNAAVAGLFGGSMMRSDREPNEPGMNRQQTRILHMVPEPKREAARAILLSRGDELTAAREARGSAQTEMLAALRAEPYQPERLTAALAARQAASASYWGIGYEQIAEIAAGLDAAERAQLADNMEERYRRWMERRDRNR